MNRIAFLCQYFYPEYVSSATLPTELAVHLASEEFDVSVYCGWPKEYSFSDSVEDFEVFKNVKINRLKYLHFKSKNKVFKLINFFSFFLSILFRLKTIAQNDLVIVYTNPPILPYAAYVAKRIFGTKFMFVVYDIYPYNAIELKVVKKQSLIAPATVSMLRKK